MQALRVADSWLAHAGLPAVLAVVAVSWRRNPQALQGLAKVPFTVGALVWGMALVAGFLVLGFWLMDKPTKRADAARERAERALRARGQ